jgi:hypothetical protein
MFSSGKNNNKENEVQAQWFAKSLAEQVAKESKVSKEEAKRLVKKQTGAILPQSFWDKL